MSFIDRDFLWFLPLVWSAWLLLRGRYTAQIVLLLGASLLFYGWRHPAVIGVIIAYAVVDWTVGVWLERTHWRRSECPCDLKVAHLRAVDRRAKHHEHQRERHHRCGDDRRGRREQQIDADVLQHRSDPAPPAEDLEQDRMVETPEAISEIALDEPGRPGPGVRHLA